MSIGRIEANHVMRECLALEGAGAAWLHLRVNDRRAAEVGKEEDY